MIGITVTVALVRTLSLLGQVYFLAFAYLKAKLSRALSLPLRARIQNGCKTNICHAIVQLNSS